MEVATSINAPVGQQTKGGGAPQVVWDAVELGLNGGDETVAFGPSVSTGSALFHIETLATVGPSAPPTSVPTVFASASEEGVTVAVGSQVHVLDGRCSSLLSPSLDFESSAENVSWSEDGTFVAIATSSGAVHFLDVTVGKVIHSQNLGQGRAAKGKAAFAALEFSAADAEGNYSMIALMSSGVLIYFTGINLSKLRAAIAAKDMKAGLEVKKNIKFLHVNTAKCHTKSIQGAAFAQGFGAAKQSVVTWGEGDAGVAVWSMVGDEIVCDAKVGRLLRGTRVVKCMMTNDRRMVMLDAAGNMSLWLLPELYLVCKGPTGVTDFVLLPGEDVDDEGTAGGFSIAMLTSTQDSKAQGKGVFKVLSLKGFDETYRLEVSSTSHLVQNSTAENIYLIEYKSADEDEEMAFHIRCLSPTLPSNRFYHLLNKQRFDEAMRLAETFGLDTDMVFRVRVTSLLDAADKDPSNEETLGQLIEHLEPITDEEIFVESCMNASLPSVQHTLTILEFAMKRLKSNEANEATSSARSDGGRPSPSPTGDGQSSERDLLQARLHGAVKRLGTFQLAVPQQFHAHAWHRFRNADLSREITSMLSASMCQMVATIWHRHTLEYDMISEVPGILPSIPESTPHTEYLQWLRDDVFPYALPQHHRLILDWVNIRARSFELYEKESWPENALEMIDAAGSVMQRFGHGSPESSGVPARQRTITSPSVFADLLCGRDLDDVSGNVRDNESSAAKELNLLRQQLLDLKYLKDEMNFAVSLSDLVLETPMGIVARILERVIAAELVAVTIERDIRPYLKRHMITGDGFLLDYMRDLMGTVVSIDTTLSGSAWEAKALAIIATIKDSNVRVEAILELMRRASVPCSAEVDGLVNAALADKSFPRLDEIREQRRLMHLKEMMQKYGIRHFNLTDTRLARGLVKHVLSRFDVETALADALQLVGAYNHLTEREAYVTRFQNLVQTGQPDRLQELLDQVPTPVLNGFGRELVVWTDIVLSDAMVVAGSEGNNRAQIISAMVLCLDTVLARAPASSASPSTSSSSGAGADSQADLRQSSMQYSRLQTLESEFGVQMNCITLADNAGCLEVLESELHTQSVAANAVAAAADSSNAPSDVSLGGVIGGGASNAVRRQSPVRRIFRLARMLGLSKAQVMGRATAILRHPDATAASAKLAITICTASDGGVVSSVEGDQLFELVRALESFCAGGNTALLADALSLAEDGIRSCSRAMLPQQLEIWRAYELAHAVERQCESGDYNSGMAESPRRAAGGSKQGPSVWDEGSSRQELSAKLFLRRYREEGLVLSSGLTANLAGGFMKAIVPAAGAGDGPAPSAATKLKAVGKSVIELIKHLTENGLEQLALRHAAVAIGVCALLRVLSDGDVIVGKICDAVLPRATATVANLSAGLLSKVLRTSHTDRQIAMGYLTVLEMQPAFGCYQSAIVASKRNFRQLSELAIIGAGFSKLWKQVELRAECEKLHKNALWYTTLSELSISFDRKQFEGAAAAEHAGKIGPELIKKCGYNLKLVTDFADHFGMEVDLARVMYIRLAMQIVDGAEIGSYVDLVQEAVSSLEENTAAVAMLKGEYAQLINPYDYERLQYTFGLIAQMDSAENDGVQWLSLLGVLQRYKRQFEPSTYEVEFSDELDASAASARTSAYAKGKTPSERLPFHHLLFGDALKILTPELSKDSVFKLAPLARVLPGGLTPDDVIVTLVKKLYDNDGAPPALGEIKTIVQRLADNETAIMTAKMIADKYPLNKFKLEALELAVSETERWLSSMTKTAAANGAEEQATKMQEKLSKIYNKTLTEWELQENGYSTATTRALLSRPAELIPQLYQEFLLAPALDAASVEKLQVVADGIAERYSLPCDELQREVVQKWLISCDDGPDGGGPSTKSAASALTSSTSNGGSGAVLSLAGLLDDDDDSSSGGGSGADGSSSPFADADLDANLNRAVALLRRSPPATAVKYLLHFAYVEESVKITPRAQLRAFQALFIIAPTTLICEIADRTVEVLRAHLLSLCYVMKLEELGLNHTPASFTESSKAGLARAIWKNHRHETSALPLVLDLCIDYEINDTVLWSNALKQLGQRARWADLSRGLVAVSATPQLWQMLCVAPMWQALLAHHLNRVKSADEGSAPQLEAASQFVRLVTSCPVLLQCNPGKMVQELAALGLEEAAKAILPSVAKQSEAQ